MLDGTVEYNKTVIDNLLKDKLSFIKETTRENKTYTVSGANVTICEFANSNYSGLYQCYIYDNIMYTTLIGGSNLQTYITFTKNGNNIDITVPAYWLVTIL